PAAASSRAIVDVRHRSNDSLARLAPMETYLLIAIIVVALIYFAFFRARVGGERAGRELDVQGREGARPAEARRPGEPAPRKPTPGAPVGGAAEEEEVVPESIELEEARKPPPERPLWQPP